METLEEAAEKYPLINQRIGFKLGAKWQQERSYSEEEVIQFGKFLTEFNNLDNEIECAIKKLLKQFKNK